MRRKWTTAPVPLSAGLPGGRAEKPVLDWSSHPAPAAASQARSRCATTTAPAKLEGGVMCPSYRATRNETDVTQGRRQYLAAGDIGPVGAGCAGIG